MGTIRRATRMPRRAANTVVVTSTDAFDSALQGVYKSLRRLSKGTRRVSKEAFFIKNGKKTRKHKKKSRRRRH